MKGAFASWIILACMHCVLPLRTSADAGEKSALTGEARAADDVPEALHLEPGASCLDKTQLTAHVGAWLGERALGAGLRIEIVGHPTQAQHVTFRLRRQDSLLAERKFEPGPALCAQLHAVIGLSISIAVRAALLYELGVMPEVRATPFTRSWSADASAMVAPSASSGLGMGVGAAANLRLLPWFEARFAVRTLYLREAKFEGTTGSYAWWSTTLSPQACLVADSVTRLVLRACTGPGAGPLVTRGYDFARTERSTLLWVGWLSRFEAWVALAPPLHITLGMELAHGLRDLYLAVRDTDGQIVRRAELESLHVSALVGLASRL